MTSESPVDSGKRSTAAAIPLIAEVSVRTITLRALHIVMGELTFNSAKEIEKPGPYVYVLVDEDERIHYIGKSDTKDAKDTRIRLYSSLAARADGDLEAAKDDLVLLALEAQWWAPIVRYGLEHNLTIRAASVKGTHETGATWEARVQALSGALANLESIQGGSAWETSQDSRREKGQAWVHERLKLLRDQGVI